MEVLVGIQGYAELGMMLKIVIWGTDQLLVFHVAQILDATAAEIILLPLPFHRLLVAKQYFLLTLHILQFALTHFAQAAHH